ncbi:MAG: hypothetical protein ABIJ21_06975 [Nanoarchaeota archaeon]
MKRTDSRIVQAPVFGTDEEENLRGYDYARRTAMPTLEEYVLAPFEGALKDAAFQKARETVGVDGEGVLLGRHEVVHTLEGKHFVIVAYGNKRSANEPVIGGLIGFLQTIVDDNFQGVNREGVRKVDDSAFVFREYFLGELDRLREENTTSFNRTDLSVKDPATGKRAQLDEVSRLQVYLDLNRYGRINPENTKAYLAAQSLRGALSGYMKSYEADARLRFGIPDKDLETSQEYDFEIADGSAVRFLFFPRKSIEYGSVLDGLVGMSTKNIAGSTGDLDIIGILAFGPDYEYLRGGAGIQVKHEPLSAHTERMVMRRIAKDGTASDRSYRIFDNEGKVYVAAEDLQAGIEGLLGAHTSVPTQFKIDLFAALPDYLQ